MLLPRRLAAVGVRLRTAQAAVTGGATTVWEVAGALNLPTEPEQLHLTISEASAALEWLWDHRRIRRSVAKGVVRYTPEGRG